MRRRRRKVEQRDRKREENQNTNTFRTSRNDLILFFQTWKQSKEQSGGRLNTQDRDSQHGKKLNPVTDQYDKL